MRLHCGGADDEDPANRRNPKEDENREEAHIELAEDVTTRTPLGDGSAFIRKGALTAGTTGIGKRWDSKTSNPARQMLFRRTSLPMGGDQSSGSPPAATLSTPPSACDI